VFRLKSKITDNTQQVAQAAEKAAFRNFGHAAASLRKQAAESIQKAEGPSPVGTAPHTHKRQFLKRAFRYWRDKESAIIGPRFSIVGDAAAAHEFGEDYKGTQFPERPFMGPLIEKNADRFADQWRGSIGE